MNTEINKRIHMEIFGNCWHGWEVVANSSYSSCTKCGVKALTTTRLASSFAYPDYSGDETQIFKVIDAMKAKGFDFRFEETKSLLWAEFATEGFKEGGQETVLDAHMSRAEVICRAALRVLEGK